MNNDDFHITVKELAEETDTTCPQMFEFLKKIQDFKKNSEQYPVNAMLKKFLPLEIWDDEYCCFTPDFRQKVVDFIGSLNQASAHMQYTMGVYDFDPMASILKAIAEEKRVPICHEKEEIRRKAKQSAKVLVKKLS